MVNTPRPPKPKTPVSIFLEVDAHVYGTPTVADLRNQGRNELIVAVTWHFDEEDGDGVGANASRRARRPGMPKGKSDHHYLANGVVVVDLMTRAPRVKQLEMTTKSSHPGAYALGSPTVFDVDGDGHKEIILGTGLGSVYVLDDKLKVLKGWPVTVRAAGRGCAFVSQRRVTGCWPMGWMDVAMPSKFSDYRNGVDQRSSCAVQFE